MNKYSQYTVLVSQNEMLPAKEAFEWNKGVHRLKHANKVLLIIGNILLLAGVIFFGAKLFSSKVDHNDFYLLMIWAFVSWLFVSLSGKDIEEKQEELVKPTLGFTSSYVADYLNEIDVPVKTTQDLFILLEKGHKKLFLIIRDQTIKRLLPGRQSDVIQAMTFFDTILFCFENGQKTGPYDIKHTFEIEGRKYEDVSGEYINKLKGRTYTSSNKFLKWIPE